MKSGSIWINMLTNVIASFLQVLLGLLSVWNISFLGYPARAILPFSQALEKLAPHIQQGRVILCDFIGVVKSQQPVYLKGEVVSKRNELMSNSFAQPDAQPDALAYGKVRVWDESSQYGTLMTQEEISR